jgi:signal transduction histidine kinase
LRGDQALVGDLDGAAGQLKQALSELRDLAQGIHPAVLSRAGIGPALRILAEVSPIPVEIKDAPSGRFSDDVEVAVYFVVSEALANAAKHSGANRVEVSVRREGASLLVDVRDDGAGGATTDTGSGLMGMTDRVAVLGGVIKVASPPGAGTVVHAEIPCA